MRTPDNAAQSWIELIPCPVLLIRMDDCRVAFSNRSARRILGGAAGPGSDGRAVFEDAEALVRLCAGLPEDGDAAPVQAYLFLKTPGDGRLLSKVQASRADREDGRYAVISLSELEEDSPDGSKAELQCNHVLWRALFDKAGVGIVLLDRNGRFIEANRRWLEMFGYTVEEIRGLRPNEIAHNDDHSTNGIGSLLRGEIDRYRAEKRYVRKNGIPFWGDLSVSLLRDDRGEPLFVIGFLIDITDRKRAEERLHEINEQLEMQLLENQALQRKLEDLAVRDPLTGLFNRRYMEETLRRELSRSAREDHPLSLVIMDIDHFKTLNDAYGHQAGDQVLRELATLLLGHMRSEDVACRFGGEEFVAILPGAPLAVAVQRAESWRRAFERLRIRYEGSVLQCTLSMGVAEFPMHGSTGDGLLFQADSALYMAKRAGRNRVMVWG